MTALLMFVLSPVGRWLAGVAGVIAVLMSLALYFDHRGASRVQARWDAANRAIAVAAERRDVQQSADVATGSQAQLDAAQETITQLSQERDAYADQLDKAEAQLRDKKCPAPARPVLDQRGVDSLRVPAARNAGPRR